MSKFEVMLPENMREAFATTAGNVFGSFDPFGTLDAETLRKNILFATSGGVSVSCTAEYMDHGDGVDNCPPNTMELLDVDSMSCKLSGTALTIHKENAPMLFAHADKSDNSGVTEIVPRMDIKTEDFRELWFVCKYGTQGGFAAVKLMNALNVGGFSWKSEDGGKGQFAFEFTGYTSFDKPREIPMRFYLKPSAAAQTQEVTA